MERDKAFETWWGKQYAEQSTKPNDRSAFIAGWEAAIQEFVVEPAADTEPWGTLEGAERYLEARDREAFMVLRRETAALVERGQIPSKYRMIQDLQSFWIGYAEAWSETRKLLPQHAEAVE